MGGQLKKVKVRARRSPQPYGFEPHRQISHVRASTFLTCFFNSVNMFPHILTSLPPTPPLVYTTSIPLLVRLVYTLWIHRPESQSASFPARSYL